MLRLSLNKNKIQIFPIFPPNIAKTLTKTALHFLKNFRHICPYSLHFSNNRKKEFNKLLTLSFLLYYL